MPFRRGLEPAAGADPNAETEGHMPLRKLEPAGAADPNETEGHMPYRRGLEPADSAVSNETEGHMPRRMVEPAGDADADGHKFIPKGERDGEAEGHARAR